jgi:hypothetical protein
LCDLIRDRRPFCARLSKKNGTAFRDGVVHPIGG